MEVQNVEVKWSLRNAAAEILDSGNISVTVSALSVWKSEKLDFTHAELRKNYVSYELWKAGKCLSQASTLFCPPKHFDFADPELTLDIQGDIIYIYAENFAKSVEIYSLDSDFILSDNFFDINSGVRMVRILKGENENLKVRSVYDIGR